MIVIGIDPGVARVGYGVVEKKGKTLVPIAYGCITTKKSESPGCHRLREIFHTVSSLIEAHSPDSLAIERLFFMKNITSAMAVSEVRGVILLAAAEHELLVSEYTPNEIKQAITGSGKADKRQMQKMIRSILALEEEPRPDDAADGLSIAVCHLHIMR